MNAWTAHVAVGLDDGAGIRLNASFGVLGARWTQVDESATRLSSQLPIQGKWPARSPNRAALRRNRHWQRPPLPMMRYQAACSRRGGANMLFHRTAVFMPGKIADGMAWAKEIVTHLNGVHGGKFRLLQQYAGNPSAVVWSGQFASLADGEQFTKKLLADPAYHKIVAKGATLLVPNSNHDDVWTEVA